MFIVFSCLCLLSCVELCIFLCHLVLFVSTLAKRFAGKTTTLVIYFASNDFPYKDQIEELFIYLRVFSTCNIVNFLVNFTFIIVGIVKCTI